MPPETTEAEFAALVARAGLSLTPAHIASLHAAWGGIDAMQRLVRTPPIAAEAEPSTTFSTEAGR
jgi:hypothetical protein